MSSRGRPTRLLVAPLCVLLAAAAPAAAQDRDRAGEATRAATTFAGKGAETVSSTCRRSGGAEEACNSVPVGRHASASAIRDYERSWVHRALGLQYELAGDVPFADAPWIGTHNSANSTAYSYTPSRSDSNQQLSLADQLRIDARSLEVDVHWVESPHAGGSKAAVVCHGTEQHIGCTSEGLLRESLAEISAWLHSKGNENEVLLLYIEDQVRNSAGYDGVAQDIEDAFGSKLYRPSGSGCSKLPLSLTRAQLLAQGAQVVIVASGCGGSSGTAAWRQSIFDWSGNVHSESRPRGFEDFPGCGPDYTRADYDSHIVRYFEDSTFVTAATATATPNPAQPPLPAQTYDDGITPATAAAMARCGVDLLGMDQLLPDDGRLESLVWSWSDGEPLAAGGDCAVQRRSDARWETARCKGARRAACRTATGDWLLTKHPVPFRHAAATCAAQKAQFAVPRTGYEAQLLNAEMPKHAKTAWLGYRRAGEAWRALDLR